MCNSWTVMHLRNLPMVLRGKRCNLKVKVKMEVRVTLQLANQFILASSPWDSWPDFFFQLNPCGHSPQVTPSLRRRWSKSKLCYNQRSVGQSVLVSRTHLGLKIFIFVRHLRVSWCGVPSLTENKSVFHNVQCTIYLEFTCYYMNVYI
jgi:hypothetical protein